MAPSMSVGLPSSPRARRLIAAMAILGGAVVGSRLLAKKLLLALLYHPSKDPDCARMMKDYASVFKKRQCRVELVQYEILPDGRSSSSSRGLHQKAILVHPEEPPTALWMIFGGNAMLASDSLPLVDILLESQKEGGRSAFLLFDYPGYAYNSGSPSPQSTLDASLAALAAAVPLLSATPRQLNLFGHSLGAAAAAQLACAWPVEHHRSGQVGPKAGVLLLTAPFTNIEGMAQVIARHVFPMLVPPSWLLRVLVAHHWDNSVSVPRAAAAGWHVRIMHGLQDEIVPFAMGRSLQVSLKQSGHCCDFVEVTGGGHNNLLTLAMSQVIKMVEETPPLHGCSSSL